MFSTGGGKENLIYLPENFNSSLRIEVYGCDNVVSLDQLTHFEGAIYVGTSDCPVQNCKVQIGDGTSSNGVELRILDDNSEIIIGKDCMFSWGIYIACSDTHAIMDMKGNLTNLGHRVHIGDHVWIGRNVSIGKDVKIADNSIVGMCSVVTSHHDFRSNCIIAGNPAIIVKQGVRWDRRRPKQYINQD